MVSFSSLEFLFRFLPIFLILYFLLPSRHRETVLLAGSLVFYAVGEPVFILVLILATFLNYFLGMRIWKHGEGFAIHEWQKRKRRNAMITAVVLDVLILAVFKGLAVFVDNSLLPIGISYYIFKMISFQADMLQGQVWKKPKFVNVALYFTIFPQVVSGPVMRYDEGGFGDERRCSLEQFEDGLKYLVLGLGLKVLLADRLAILWNDLQMIGFQSISTPLAWFGAAGYSLQLYFDFWGYSVMAMGLGKMLGFRIPQNFDSPYASRSISEFWRRWHITLGRWFREYVYFPLGGSRKGRLRTICNVFIVWGFTGLWHGADWNFVLWGLLFFLLLTIEKNSYGRWMERTKIFGRLYTLAVIPITWVVFAISDMKQLAAYLGNMFGIQQTGVMVGVTQLLRYLQEYGGLLAVCILFATPFPIRWYNKWKDRWFAVLMLAVIFWFSVHEIMVGSNNPFLYFRF